MEALLNTSLCPASPSGATANSSASCRSERAEKRDRRFAWLLIGVWIVNLFDLELTLLAAQQRMLGELNPVAGQLLPFGAKALTCYKFALLALGSLILWRYRSHWLAMGALWVVAIACVALSLVWYQLYFGPEPAWGGINTACSISSSSL